MRTPLPCALLLLVTTVPALGQARHTRYELHEPGSGRFRILYDTTATEPGATTYRNSVRAGASVSDVAVTDLASGRPLEFEVGEDAILVQLARPVPDGGAQRLRIDKTYEDAASHHVYAETGELVFDSGLSIARNTIVLPSRYEVTSCNVPVQVEWEEGGRIALSFQNTTPARMPLVVRARLLPIRGGPPLPPEPAHLIGEPPPLSAPSGPRPDWTFERRVENTRDIVYFLQQPETHAFRLYHDFTETRPGRDHYANFVRAGSRASDPEARNLDTGEALVVEEYEGEAIREAGIPLTREVGPEDQLVLARFPPVEEGASLRLRITETYTDPHRYGLRTAEELVWFRRFGRPTNAVVLPEGWYQTASAIPATISTLADGRVRLDLANQRPDRIVTMIRARRR